MKRLILLLLLIPSVITAQHSIEGTFLPAKDFTYAFLYKANPSGASYVDRAKVDENGEFKIEMDSTYEAGIYKIVYGVPQEKNNFDLIYNAKEDVVLEFGLETGLDFKESNENKLWTSYTNSIEMINRAIGNFYTKKSEDKEAFKDIFKTLKETQDAFELASKGTMASIFIKANKPYIPQNFEDLESYSKNLKTTYLESVDFNNELLQSSEFLTDRVMAFVFGMSAQPDDAFYKEQIDVLVKHIGTGNNEIKNALLKTVWFHMVQIGESTVANYITDTYLMDLAKQENDVLLIDELKTYKNTSIGATAIDFPISTIIDGTATKTSLLNLHLADQYLLIFWNSGCSHCLEQLPVIRDAVKKIDSHKLRVIAYGTQGESAQYEKEIGNYPNFIHVIDDPSTNRFMGNEYGVVATPTYFILDKDKKIIAKPDSVEDVTDYINSL